MHQTNVSIERFPGRSHPLQWIVVHLFCGALIGAAEAGGFQFLATLALTGLVVGIGQWWVLRSQWPRSSGWILATTLGWLVGMQLTIAMSGIVTAATALLTQWIGWEVLWLNVIDQTLTLLVVGLAQWLLLRRRSAHANEWIGISAIAGTVAGAVGATTCFWVCDAVIQATGSAIASTALVYAMFWLSYSLVTLFNWRGARR